MCVIHAILSVILGVNRGETCVIQEAVILKVYCVDYSMFLSNIILRIKILEIGYWGAHSSAAQLKWGKMYTMKGMLKTKDNNYNISTFKNKTFGSAGQL